MYGTPSLPADAYHLAVRVYRLSSCSASRDVRGLWRRLLIALPVAVLLAACGPSYEGFFDDAFVPATEIGPSWTSMEAQCEDICGEGSFGGCEVRGRRGLDYSSGREDRGEEVVYGFDMMIFVLRDDPVTCIRQAASTLKLAIELDPMGAGTCQAFAAIVPAAPGKQSRFAYVFVAGKESVADLRISFDGSTVGVSEMRRIGAAVCAALIAAEEVHLS